jgi:hypothetical protein
MFLFYQRPPKTILIEDPAKEICDIYDYIIISKNEFYEYYKILLLNDLKSFSSIRVIQIHSCIHVFTYSCIHVSALERIPRPRNN